MGGMNSNKKTIQETIQELRNSPDNLLKPNEQLIVSKSMPRRSCEKGSTFLTSMTDKTLKCENNHELTATNHIQPGSVISKFGEIAAEYLTESQFMEIVSPIDRTSDEDFVSVTVSKIIELYTIKNLIIFWLFGRPANSWTPPYFFNDTDNTGSYINEIAKQINDLLPKAFESGENKNTPTQILQGLLAKKNNPQLWDNIVQITNLNKDKQVSSTHDDYKIFIDNLIKNY